MNLTAQLKQAAELIRGAAGATVALTGAGASVESGVPDFRSPGGIWSRYSVAEYATIEAFLADPAKVWTFVRDLVAEFGDAAPNPGHRALARLEAAGYLRGVITQNIDGLHHQAGSRAVVEFHGSMRQLVCLRCHQKTPFRREEHLRRLPPRCRCGAALKPDFIFFGEAIPEEALATSHLWATSCRVLLVAGTSAEVAPASAIPYRAVSRGARVIELNLAPTILTEDLDTLFLAGPFAELLPRLADLVTG